MANLSQFMPQAEAAANLIDALMQEQVGLQPPAKYELNSRGGRVYLVAHYDPLTLGKSVKAYEDPDLLRRLRVMLGMPVQVTKETGTRYVILMQGSLRLPRSVSFPETPGTLDIFRLGVGLKGEISLSARDLRNVIIGAGQGMGKSTILYLLTIQMLDFGWKLYLADPQSHTFNPDLWNQFAAMPVAGSQADLLKVIEALESETADRVMKFRMASLDGTVPDDIDAYNATAAEPLPRIGFVLDEVNFYLDNKLILNRLADLLRQGRKWGLHICMAGHEWHKDDVPARLNDMLQTRIALNSLSGTIVLRNHQWGKWVEGKPPGRGVLRTNSYEPIQFYQMDGNPVQKRLAAPGAHRVSPIPASEVPYIRRAIEETQGKMTMGLLTGWGMSQEEARTLGTRYELRGWLEKRKEEGNARFVTEKLLLLMAEFHPNPQTPQSPQTAYEVPQTVPQTPQTADSGEEN